jgi:methionyl-tRNA synthetase
VTEENWFFKLYKYTAQIKKGIETDELKILPAARKKEILNLLDDAEDISFSRSAKSLTWGIPVPNDSAQTMYVWVDALPNYISALGWDHEGDDFKKFWPADIHLIGKDIFRFHAMIWPAMLISAGLELPKAIYVHGFVTSNGEKMSKSLGNVVDPVAMVEKYGADVVRYFLLREIPSDEDGDFSEEKLVARYNGDLANGLGNLVSRVSTLIASNVAGQIDYTDDRIEPEIGRAIQEMWRIYDEGINVFRLHDSLAAVGDLLGVADKYMNDTKPWALVKEDQQKFISVMNNMLAILWQLTRALEPFIPHTTEKIRQVFSFEKGESMIAKTLRVEKSIPLFPRLP